MGLVKSRKRIPNVVRGGKAVPISNDLFLMQGRKHEQGGIDIGESAKNGLEVEGGEVMQIGKNNVRVFSAVPFLNGQSPSQLVQSGANPNTVFNAQEQYKDRNHINDDGTKARGGLSRKTDYGSSKKPYPSVSSGDFAGGGRSYPIPTKADAVDALRLAGLHGRSDVKAKVYARYPELRKKSAMGTKRKTNSRRNQYQDPNDPNTLYGLTPDSNQTPLSPPVQSLLDYSNNTFDYSEQNKRLKRNRYIRRYRQRRQEKDVVDDRPMAKLGANQVHTGPVRRRANTRWLNRKYNKGDLNNIKTLKELESIGRHVSKITKTKYNTNPVWEDVDYSQDPAVPKLAEGKNNNLLTADNIAKDLNSHNVLKKGWKGSDNYLYSDPNYTNYLMEHPSDTKASDEDRERINNESQERLKTGSSLTKEEPSLISSGSTGSTTDETQSVDNLKFRSPYSYWQDATNFGLNTGGALAGYFINRNALSKRKDGYKPALTPNVNYPTTYSIAPQLSALNNTRAAAERAVNASTASSKTALARNLAIRGETNTKKQKLYAEKNNEENKLIGEKQKLNATINESNAKATNEARQIELTNRNNRLDKQSENRVSLVNNLTKSFNDWRTNIEERRKTNNTILADVIGRQGVTPSLIRNIFGKQLGIKNSKKSGRFGLTKPRR